MKILKLSFENLNSLKGKWQIDFEDPAFDAQAIFAITGPTGAGKTTVLDAICLALYGETPRLDNISPAHNDIMSVGSASASSELIFKIDDKIYRAYWAQRRAKNKADGKLQAISRELCELKHSDDNEGKILEEKATRVKKHIEDLLGMTMMQFTRSVMLVQGDFAAFLQSNAEERGTILEQITGTQIYSDIGKAAFEKNKQQNLALKELNTKLGEVQLLSDEAYQELNHNLQNAQNTKHTLTANLQSLENEYQLASEYQSVQQDLQNYQSMLIKTQKQLDDFAPQIEQLKQAEKARNIQPLYDALQTLSHEKSTYKNRVTLLQSQLDTATEQLQSSEINLNKKSKELQQSQEAYDRQKPLIAQVRKLDEIIALKSSEATNIHRNLNECRDVYQNTQKQNAHISNSFQQTLQTLTELYAQNPVGNLEQQTELIHQLKLNKEQISAALQEIQMHLLNIGDIKQELHTDIQHTESLRHEYKQNSDACQQADLENQSQSRILNERLKLQPTLSQTGELSADCLEIHLYRDALSQIHQANKQHLLELQKCQEIQSLNQQLTSLQQDAKTAQDAQQNHQAQFRVNQQHLSDLQNQLEQQQRTHATLNDNFELHKQILSMRQHLQQLAEGNPCPLCGSHTHPYKQNTHEQDDSLFEQAKQQLDESQALIEQLHEKIHALNTENIKLESNIQLQTENLDKINQRISNLNSQIDDLLRILSDSTPTTTAEVAQYQRKIQKLIHDNEQMISELSPQIEALQEIRTRLHNHKLQQEKVISAGQQAHEYKLKKFQTALQHRCDIERAAQILQQQLQTTFELFERMQLPAHALNQQAQALISSIHLGIQPLQQVPKDISDYVKQLNKEDIKPWWENGENIHLGCIQLLDDNIKELQTQYLQHKQLNEKVQLLEQQKLKLATQLEEGKNLLSQQEKQLSKANAELEQKQTQLTQTQMQRQQLFHETDVQVFENRLQASIEASRTNCKIAQDAQQQAREAHHSLTITIKNTQDILENINEKQQKANQAYQDKLLLEFTSQAQFLAAILPDAQYQALKQENERLMQQHQQNKLAVNNATQKQKSLVQKCENITELNVKELNNQIQQTKEELAQIYESIGQLSTQQDIEQKNRAHQQALLNQIAQQQKANAIWAKLDMLIGSADGKKYRNFVQGLTLDLVLMHANQILQKMNDRYLLTHEADGAKPLEIFVTDMHQGATVRSSKNLSGGESFMVSLALALGLSQINSRKVHIESLFLDEGFGTLDEDALDMALSTLFELQQSGKSIGIISHVTSLKERIDTQIVIEKRAGGISQMSGAGVSRLD